MLGRVLNRQATARRSDGFTLIELLMVIAIIGVLASIVVAAVFNATTSASVAACKSNYKTVELAEETYKSQVGSAATTFTVLETSTTGLNQTSVGPWLHEVPTSTKYTIGFDLTPGARYGAVTVATSGHAAADGNGNCQYAG